jgi:sulfatase maturation enzyme AslB (radical SAM superfamily)
MLLDGKKDGNMTWSCAAIDHGVTIFPNGKIAPCCQITSDYLKPISELSNPARFLDLKKQDMSPTHPCNKCSVAEHHGLSSYRSIFDRQATLKPGIQFLDIRNSNLCNLKCRYCGPHFSNRWAEEIGNFPALHNQNIDSYKNILFTDSLQLLYFTGGEPLINGDHWAMLQEIIDNKQAHRIVLSYNTNLTTIKYKEKNIIDIWKNFKNVTIQCSIDAVGLPLEYIRSGSDWEKIKSNLSEILKMSAKSNITIMLSPVLSILNIWFIDDLYKYAKIIGVPVHMIILTGPDYLALDVIPDSLKKTALKKIDKLEFEYGVDNKITTIIRNMINNNINQSLFTATMSHVLLLDKMRDEKLFDLLPFKSVAIDNILKNHEYE